MLLEAIYRNITDNDDESSYDLPALKNLANKPLSVKLAVAILAIEGNVEPGPVLRALRLGQDRPQAHAKHVILNTLPDLNAVQALAKSIDDLNPDQQNVAMLLKIGQRLAQESDADFVPYINRLHGTATFEDHSIEINPAYKPLKLPQNQLIELVGTWLMHTPALTTGTTNSATEYSNIEALLGPGGLMGTGSPRIPRLMHNLDRHLQGRFGNTPQYRHWLGYTAAHLLDRRLQPQDDQVLDETLVHLAQLPELNYIGSQLIGRSQNLPALCETLRGFKDKPLGLLLHAAVPEEPELARRFAQAMPFQFGYHLPNYVTMVQALSEFSGTAELKPEAKAYLLRLAADHVEQSNNSAQSAMEMMQVLGTIGRLINQGEERSQVMPAYGSWLPKAESADQLRRAANPDRAFLEGLTEYLIDADPRAAHMLAAKLKPNDEMDNSSSSGLALPVVLTLDTNQAYEWILPKIKAWAATSDPAELMNRALHLNGLLTETLDDGEYRFSDKYPNLREIAEQAEVTDNRALLGWVQMAGLLWHSLGAPNQIPKIATEQLQSIGNFHNEHYRMGVTLCLYRAVSDPDTAKAFKTFTERFKAKHTKIFAAPLLLAAGDPRALPELTKVVQSRGFKDTRRVAPMVKFLSEMALSKSLDPMQKQRILDVVSQGASNYRDGVTPDMAHALALVKIADADTSDKGLALAALRGLHDRSDTQAASKALSKILYGITDQESTHFHDDYSKFMQHSRANTTLSFYATSIYLGIARKEVPASMRDEVGLMARALVARDGGAMAKDLRYDVKNSPHNAKIKDTAPDAWRLWQEPVQRTEPITFNADDLVNHVDPARFLHDKIIRENHAPEDEFSLLISVLDKEISVAKALEQLPEHAPSPHKAIERQLLMAVAPGNSMSQSAQHLRAISQDMPFPQLAFDIKTLIKKLEPQPLSAEKCSSLKASISDNREDLFLCGTEIMGSCLNIHGNPSFTKALPGYLLDGKYLSAQICNDQGALMWRRMLRLTWSIEHEKPVIYVDREYGNLGVPDKLKAATLRLVQEKALRMGALVAVDDNDEYADNEVTNLGAVHVLRSGRQFEYVDALESTMGGR
ncbi:hypothetical protein ACFQDN_22945 [Pseudomonas asuensis]